MKKQKGAFFYLLFFLLSFTLEAQSASGAMGIFFPDAPVLGSRAAIVMDATTGTLLFHQNPDEEIPPASLTKLMTMHIAYQEIAAGRINLDDYFYPPRASWANNQPPRSSLMGLANGQRITLRDLLLGLAIPSGNDAAVAVALLFAPSVEDFVARMNNEAALLGLEKTRFVEPAGISEYNMTTAREFANFARFYIEKYPEALRNYHSVPSFTYPKEENILEDFQGSFTPRIRWNSNYLLGRVEGVDGLKTGYIDEAGYNIALTAERNGTRLLAVVLGAPAEWGGSDIRDEDGKNLLNWAFDRYQTVRPLDPELPPSRVWKGKEKFVNLIPNESLEFTASIDRANTLYIETILNEPFIAPLPAGGDAGIMVISDEKGELRRVSLITKEEIPQGNFFKRIWDSILLFFRNRRNS